MLTASLKVKTLTAKMAGLRTTTHHTNLLNAENDSRIQNGKLAAARATGAGVRSTRAAMAEIGNNQGMQRGGLRSKDANAAAVIKPARMMTKQKATSSLKTLGAGGQSSLAAPKPLVDENVRQQPARNRKRKQSNEKENASSESSMDIDGVSALPQDVEMEEDVITADEEVATAFSSKELAAWNVDDIDSEDVDDPQLVVQYVNEIYEYMRFLERAQAVKKDYLSGRIGVILPKMRSVLVEWLVEVHQQFSLLQETLYLSVCILDRYMQVNAEKVQRKQLQLVGVTAMFIAAKYEEMYAPEIGDFVYITDNAYTPSQIREMEIKIMSVLKFDLGRPLPLHFLRRNSKAGQVDATAHTMAKYVMELTLLEYRFAHVLPSEVAAAALAFSLKALDVEERPLSEIWNNTLEYYSQYSLEDISQLVQDVATMVLTTTRAPEKAKLLAIRKKYSNKKFGKIAEYGELVSPAVEQMAQGNFN